MSAFVTHTYVLDVLALQQVDTTPEVAGQIAAALASQLTVAGPVYNRLHFEDEPSAFLAATAGERA